MEFSNMDWFYTLMSNLTKMIRFEWFHIRKQNSYITFLIPSSVFVFLCFIAAELLSDLEGAFQEKIDVAYFDTSKYLLDVLNRNYLLLEHLQAMRRYLLLGQGDFIRHLMDLLKLAAHNSTLLQQKKPDLVLANIRFLFPGLSWCVLPPLCTSTIWLEFWRRQSEPQMPSLIMQRSSKGWMCVCWR